MSDVYKQQKGESNMQKLHKQYKLRTNTGPPAAIEHVIVRGLDPNCETFISGAAAQA